MTPVNGNPGKFWAVRYFADPNNGFKWNTVKSWGGDFFSLGTDVGFTTSGGNAFVSAAGFYIGQSCVEEMEDGYLLPQPFDRCSHYMSKEVAEKYLESFKD